MVLFLPDPDDPPGRFLTEADKPNLPINWISVVAGAAEYFARSSPAATHSCAAAAGWDLYAPFAGGILGRSIAHGRGTDIVPDSIGDHSQTALDGIARFRCSGERRAYNHHPHTRRRNEALHDHFSPLIIGAPSRDGLLPDREMRPSCARSP